MPEGGGEETIVNMQLGIRIESRESRKKQTFFSARTRGAISRSYCTTVRVGRKESRRMVEGEPHVPQNSLAAFGPSHTEEHLSTNMCVEKDMPNRPRLNPTHRLLSPWLRFNLHRRDFSAPTQTDRYISYHCD